MVRFSNASPHKAPNLGLDISKLDIGWAAVSRGSVPQIACVSLQPQTAADVVPIQKARLEAARQSYRPERLTVNLSPYDEGQMAAERGKGTKACPYTEFDPEYDEWMEGYES
mgnify:CR=1 FL=1